MYFVYSLCTTLSLEWEPDLIAISALYLSCRLLKFEVTSWMDKPDDYTGKWYTFFVNDVNLSIIESKFLICVDMVCLFCHMLTIEMPFSGMELPIFTLVCVRWKFL